MSCLECPICFKNFTRPIFLNCCGHSLCEGCLLSWNHSFCPLCRGSIPDQEDWVINRSLESAIDELSNAESPLILSHWSIQHASSEIGKNTLSTVFFGADVAVKTADAVDPISLSSSDSIWPKLRHPNIVQLYGVIESTPTTSVILYELCRSGSLDTVLHNQRRAFSIRETITVLRGIICGLEYLHTNCYIHGNLDSSNVLLTSDVEGLTADCVKLSGFKCVQGTSSSREGGNIKPQIAYTAPELIGYPQDALAKRESSGVTDMYSFGVVMWELITGTRPWTGMSDDQIIAAVSKGQQLPTPAPTSCSSGSLLQLLSRCLHSKVRPTASEVRLQLELLASGRPLSVTYAPCGDCTARSLSGRLGGSSPHCTPVPPDSPLSVALQAVVAATMRPAACDLFVLATGLERILELLEEELFSDGSDVVTPGHHSSSPSPCAPVPPVSGCYRDVSVAVLAIIKVPHAEGVITQLSCRIMMLCMVQDPSLASLLADNNAVALVMDVLQHWAMCPSVSESALAALAHLCRNSPLAGPKVLCNGGCEAIVKLIRSLMDSAAVVCQGCALISTLSFHADDYVLSRLLAADACDGIVAALETHLDDVAVVEQGVAALANLGLVKSSVGKLKFEKSFACDTVTRTLNAYPSNGTVVMHALSAVASLVDLNKRYRSRLGDSGICLAVLVAVALHLKNAVVVKQACDAINGLAAYHPDNVDRLFEGDVCDSLVRIMLYYVDDPDMLMRACAAVACLSYTVKVQQQEAMVRSGVCHAVVCALDKFVSHRDLARQAMGALITVANFETPLAIQALNEAEASLVLPRAIQRHPKVKEVVVNGLFALQLISGSSRRRSSNRSVRSSGSIDSA